VCVRAKFQARSGALPDSCRVESLRAEHEVDLAWLDCRKMRDRRTSCSCGSMSKNY
jgi:hypothetical protein